MKNFLTYSITFCSIIFLNVFSYNSQIGVGQDRFLNEKFFKNKKSGVFIDIGAHDGITHSNTYFFEKELGWSGICFEPLPNAFEKLKKIRQCICINACIGDVEGFVKFIEVKGAPEMLSGMLNTYDPRHLERLKHEIIRDGGSYQIIDVPSCRFNTMMKKYHIRYIDYLSLDTEGSELEILKSINFDEIYIYAISVENNYNTPAFKKFLESKNFKLVAVLGGQDEIFINNKINR